MCDFEKLFLTEVNKDIDIQKYIDCMAEIKFRIIELTKSCEVFFTDKKVNVILLESICLQIRKILELVAMSSLVCNKEAFEQANSKFNSMWNGKDIIKSVKEYNKFVFPMKSYEYKNIAPHKLTNEYHNLKETKNVLNENAYIEIYNKCGGIIHTNNPYGGKSDKINTVCNKITQWCDTIFNTIALHTACPYGMEHKRYLIYLGDFSCLTVYAKILLVI